MQYWGQKWCKVILDEAINLEIKVVTQVCQLQNPKGTLHQRLPKSSSVLAKKSLQGEGRERSALILSTIVCIVPGWILVKLYRWKRTAFSPALIKWHGRQENPNYHLLIYCKRNWNVTSFWKEYANLKSKQETYNLWFSWQNIKNTGFFFGKNFTTNCSQRVTHTLSSNYSEFICWTYI